GVELISRTPNSLKIRVEAAEESNPKLLSMFASKNIPVVALQEETRTLEQVYLKVMAQAKGYEYVQ
ncbi:MAG TPA: hypothetical protein DEP19_09490, partial [Anaerolineae bacterium]|nr:hypothetical protein [Anaerolineae bacterium]